jgi:hypothetical protein
VVRKKSLNKMKRIPAYILMAFVCLIMTIPVSAQTSLNRNAHPEDTVTPLGEWTGWNPQYNNKTNELVFWVRTKTEAAGDRFAHWIQFKLADGAQWDVQVKNLKCNDSAPTGHVEVNPNTPVTGTPTPYIDDNNGGHWTWFARWVAVPQLEEDVPAPAPEESQPAPKGSPAPNLSAPTPTPVMKIQI